jgi:hypothetical protein
MIWFRRQKMVGDDLPPNPMAADFFFNFLDDLKPARGSLAKR